MLELKVAMHKHLKSLSLSLVCSCALLACAPDRTDFTNKAFRPVKAPAKVLAPIITPAGLAVVIKPKQLANVRELVAKLNSNTETVAAGAYRIIRRKGPVTKQVEMRRQSILSVENGIAQYETRNEESGEITARGKMSLDELAPIRTAVRALAEERFDDMYALIAGLIALQNGANAIPPDAQVEIEVREAGHLPNADNFKLLIITKISAGPGKNATPIKASRLSFEVHFAPGQPRPFDVTYVAYGTNAANKSFLDVAGFSPQ